jgi:hypothetical protein
VYRPFALSVVLLVCACSNDIQLTSGAEFVEARGTSGLRPIDADIAKIAAVEPDLQFPARIGVARIVNGELTLPTAEEGELLAELGARNATLGEFVQVSPLVASMVTGSNPDGLAPQNHSRRPEAVVHDIRKTAARQHLDYVLIYEIGARASERDTVFALADVTLIGGALLPTRNIKVAGVGQAIFLDVRTGYPYGTAQAAADLSGLGRSFGGDRREAQLRDKATDKVFVALVPEVEEMFTKLITAAGAKK